MNKQEDILKQWQLPPELVPITTRMVSQMQHQIRQIINRHKKYPPLAGMVAFCTVAGTWWQGWAELLNNDPEAHPDAPKVTPEQFAELAVALGKQMAEAKAAEERGDAPQ